jgi:hypothetical protein
MENAEMKSKKLIPYVAVAFSALMAVLLVAGAAAAPDPFQGTWYSVDTDTSNQTLRVGGGPGGSYHVRYYDYGASVCGWTPLGGGDAASAQGSLSASGLVLSGDLPVYCLASPRYLWGTGGFEFTYDAGTDTLTDSHGVEWHH